MKVSIDFLTISQSMLEYLKSLKDSLENTLFNISEIISVTLKDMNQSIKLCSENINKNKNNTLVLLTLQID